MFSTLHGNVLVCLMGTLSFPTLSRLRATCTVADSLVSREMEFHFSKALRLFVSSPDTTRAILRLTGSVVSGSVAVSIAAAEQFIPADLDVYTNPDSAQVVIHSFEDQGYRVASEESSDGQNYHGGVSRVVQMRNGEQGVDLVVSRTASAILPISFFWSTLPMVYFSADGFCSLYPTWLEQSRGLFNPGRVALGMKTLRELGKKYAGRGFDVCLTEEEWPMKERMSASCLKTRSPICPVTTRYVGDRFTLQVSMAPVSVRRTQSAFTGNLQTLTTVWWRGGKGCGGQCNEDEVTGFDAWTQEVDMVGR